VENILKTLTLIPPDAILCLNGLLPLADELQLLRAQEVPLIAADGAATQLRRLSLLPDVIVGDCDSIAPELDWWQKQRIPIHCLEDQNSTDFEKSLEYALAATYRNILIVGAHGGDFDHTLNNWSIIQRWGQRLNLCVYDNGKMAIPVYTSVRFSSVPSAMISLLPQPTARLTTTGLRWELHGELLAFGIREGARNRAVQEQVELVLHEGSLLLMLHAFLPMMYSVQ
jgi:thiamine pyrophosphokinase